MTPNNNPSDGPNTQWAVFDSGFGERHVVPLEDTREHALTDLCWCQPRRDEEAPEVVIHNPGDERELFERGERRPS